MNRSEPITEKRRAAASARGAVTDGSASKTSKPRRRRKGRPKNDDPGIGPESIIQNTAELLRQYPPSQVTRVMAAKASGVHPSLIHYYFKTRSSLMIAVAAHFVEEFRHRIQTENAKITGTPAERLRARIVTLVDAELSYPYLARLLIDEVLPSDQPDALELVQGLGRRGATDYRALIAEGVESDELRDIDGGWLFTSVIGLCQFFESARVLYSAFIHPDVSDDELRANYHDFIVDLLFNAVLPKP